MQTEVLNVNGEKHTRVSKVNKIIPIEEIIGYWERGLSDTEIAKQLDCSRVNVFKRLRPYREQLETVKSYQGAENLIIAAIRQKVAYELLGRDLKKESFRDLMVGFGIAKDKSNDNKGITNNYFQVTVQSAHEKDAHKLGNVVEGQVLDVDNTDKPLISKE